MNSDHCYAVIMAGGGGTRLWPLSRQAKPKQMVHFFPEGTLFQMAVRRLLGLFTYDRIYVVTIADQVNDLRVDCPELPVENFLIEPQPRGTASVIGLAGLALSKRDPQAIMAVVTADHFIRDEQVYHNLLKASVELASEDYLVTLGITPTYASTGYGYVQHGDLIGVFQNLPAYHVQSFREKPNESLARQFIENGDHDWNSGMFVWRAARIMGEFARQMPELMSILKHISDHWDSPDKDEVIAKNWLAIKPQTIDYGIMEHAERVAVIPATGLGWSDVGSWDSMFEVLPSDENGNVVMGGQHIGVNTKNTLVSSSDPHRLVATIGVSDLIIVDTGDALLICPRSQAQNVRQIVSYLRETDRKEFW